MSIRSIFCFCVVLSVIVCPFSAQADDDEDKKQKESSTSPSESVTPHVKKKTTTRRYLLEKIVMDINGISGIPTVSVLTPENGENSVSQKLPLPTNGELKSSPEIMQQEAQKIYGVFQYFLTTLDLRQTYVKGYRWYYGTNPAFREHTNNLMFLVGLHHVLGGIDLGLAQYLYAQGIPMIIWTVAGFIGVIMMAPFMDPLCRLVVLTYGRSERFQQIVSAIRRGILDVKNGVLDLVDFRDRFHVARSLETYQFLKRFVKPTGKVTKIPYDSERNRYEMELGHRDSPENPMMQLHFFEDRDRYFYLERVVFLHGTYAIFRDNPAARTYGVMGQLEPLGWNIQDALTTLTDVYVSNIRAKQAHAMQNVSFVERVETHDDPEDPARVDITLKRSARVILDHKQSIWWYLRQLISCGR